jgi:hypothetical protein
MSLFDELSDFIGASFVSREITFKNKTRLFNFRELSADEAEEFFAKVDKDQKKNKGLRNRLLALTVSDDKGKPALTEEQAGKLPNELANKLQDAALEVNGLNKAAEAEAKKE